ncbi:YqcC family protein [Marinobacter lutaoensis]|jgi:uncharacterized protein YqcC (DUF446 family)|uniref:Pseudouridine synthase n=1 Tax=Marinobacter lutaoensis TaxID=135739 RepID=A0A1V2DP45_9GAMM|nr:YqcC family protein [Marinobacter lutaoensis]MBE02939.1 pseudouridine synthase [Marinobacter sp.]MBI42013.1 pseudouridine synthase [Oceanospirillales bacterium]NVD36602.1 YqcC family protein [Marinobacter lutaoensis]ONF42404.1 pseudouridine synthase [Marinobacter lutaoensis]|tara:strand:+ start:2281 stop:2616 length:336 start_codon:yes stop_codon:yes gene_type:complete
MTESDSRVARVADSLLRIEIELRRLGAWESEPPPAEAFRSDKPFCLDTMAFTQWLQFVFVDRMKVLIEGGHRLPEVSGIAPMAEEHFRGRPESGRALIRELEVMDRLLSGS